MIYVFLVDYIVLLLLTQTSLLFINHNSFHNSHVPSINNSLSHTSKKRLWRSPEEAIWFWNWMRILAVSGVTPFTKSHPSILFSLCTICKISIHVGCTLYQNEFPIFSYYMCSYQPCFIGFPWWALPWLPCIHSHTHKPPTPSTHSIQHLHTTSL